MKQPKVTPYPSQDELNQAFESAIKRLGAINERAINLGKELTKRRRQEGAAKSRARRKAKGCQRELKKLMQLSAYNFHQMWHLEKVGRLMTVKEIAPKLGLKKSSVYQLAKLCKTNFPTTD